MSSFTNALITEHNANGKTYTVNAYFEYHIGKLGSGKAVAVNRGLVTDLASIPRILHSILPKTGKHSQAAVVHDTLYAHNVLKDGTMVNRKFADKVFLEAMLVLKVSRIKAKIMYWGVRLFGSHPWNRYRENG